MDLNSITIMVGGILPDQITFALNNNKSTYMVDCVYNNVKINGENKSMTVHIDNASLPKNTDLYMTPREGKDVWFDIFIPD